MGIIQKQALRSSLVNFIGVGFGAITRLSMPVILTERQIGLIQLLDSVSGFFVTIFSLGYTQILSMIFPKFRDEESGHHGFLIFGILLSILGVTVSWLIFYFFGDYYFNSTNGNDFFKAFSFLIFPLIFFRIIFRNLDGYIRMLFNTVFGVFLESFINKLLLMMSIVAFALSWINFEFLAYAFSLILCLPGLFISAFALIKTKKITLPSKELLAPSNRKLMLQYSMFGVFTGLSGSVVLYIDSLMVNKMISIEALGIYSTFYFAARLIIIPALSINRISAVILAESWKNKDMDNIQSIYEKSCLNQLILGTFLFVLGWACMDPVLSFSPKLLNYADYKFVFFFLGIGLLVEMMTGTNAAIISTSKKYKYETYFNLILAGLIIVFNYFLIKQFQVVGAAAASFLAMMLINIIRWWFLNKNYGLQPFNGRFLKAFLIAASFICLVCFVDYEAQSWVKLLVNATFITIAFWSVILGLNISPDMNNWIKKIYAKFVKR